MSFDIISNIAGDLLKSTSGDGNPATLQIGNDQLERCSIGVESISVGLLPADLRKQFVWREPLGVGVSKPFQANSVVLAVLPMRLDAEGNMIHAAPSIKAAIGRSKLSKYLPCKEWGEPAVLSPDLYIEGWFYDAGPTFLTAPAVVKQPYPAAGGNVAVSLSTATYKAKDAAERYSSARATFQGLMQQLAAELGVPAYDQFLVCLFGFPQRSGEQRGKGERSPYWACAFEGAYLVGGMKLPSKPAMKELTGMSVGANFMVGGRSMADRLAEQLMQARAGGAAAVPVSNQPPVAPAVPTAPTVTNPVAASTPTTEAMPSAGILQKLGPLTGADDFQLEL